MLANNVRSCAGILRQVNPGGRIYVWSDMFDPNHNAHANYYLTRGNFTNSWSGLDSDIIVVPWYYGQRAASLQFFAKLGNRQLIAGYYDSAPTLVTNWLNAARPYAGICGVMYTTWQIITATSKRSNNSWRTTLPPALVDAALAGFSGWRSAAPDR